MRHLRDLRTVVALLAASLLVAGCSSGDASDSSVEPERVEVSKEFCKLLTTDEIPDDLASVAPASHRKAVDAVLKMDQAMSDDEGPDPASVKAMSQALGAEGVAAQLAGLAESAEKECGPSEGAATLGNLAITAEMAGAPKDDDYCEALVTAFDGDGRGGGEPSLAEVRKIAPDAHAEGLRAFDEAMSAGARPKGDVAATAGLAAFGLGLYAEATCGIKDGFVTMALAGAFIGAGGSEGPDSEDSTTDSDGSGSSGADTAQTPDEADPTAAGEAAPPGDEIAFEVEAFSLDEDGEAYLVSAVVPSGWEMKDSFGRTYEPASDLGLSIFTELRFDTGCDGVCEPTDWEARLRGDDGYLTSIANGATVTDDRAVDGSDGVVVTTEGSDGSVDGYVLRWDDQQPKYFLCTISLEAEQAAWLDAFVAACESSRPGWIKVS